MPGSLCPVSALMELILGCGVWLGWGKSQAKHNLNKQDEFRLPSQLFPNQQEAKMQHHVGQLLANSGL